MGGVFLWQHRSERIARLALGAALAATALWAFVLLDRSATFFPALRTAVLVPNRDFGQGKPCCDRVFIGAREVADFRGAFRSAQGAAAAS